MGQIEFWVGNEGPFEGEGSLGLAQLAPFSKSVGPVALGRGVEQTKAGFAHHQPGPALCWVEGDSLAGTATSSETVMRLRTSPLTSPSSTQAR